MVDFVQLSSVKKGKSETARKYNNTTVFILLLFAGVIV
jgi:hypothetical protein